MSLDKFTKQPYEEFGISVDFTANFSTGETVTAATVTAIDKAGTVSTDLILDIGTLDYATTPGIVSLLVKAGTVLLSPYKITFRIETSTTHKWEKDVQMIIKEL